MSFAKGLSSSFISTPVVVPGAVLSGSETTLRSAGQSSGFSSIATSASDASRTILHRSVVRTPCLKKLCKIILVRTLLNFHQL